MRFRRSSSRCCASAKRSGRPTSRTCSAFLGSTPFRSWSSSISAASRRASGKGGSCARGRRGVRCGRRWKGAAHVWAGLPGTADRPRDRADSLRREPTAGPRPLTRLERQGGQDGRQRGQGRGHRRRDEEARGEQDVTARADFLVAAALSLLTVVSRLPYRARLLYNWDAVQFALVLREYDVLKHQPHPPGYILYVVVGRIVNAWLDDPTAAYVALAVAFSGLTTFVVYYLACAVYDRTTALAAAALLAVSPLFWFYGSVGASVELADSVVKPTSILGGPLETTLRMSRHLLESVLVALGPLAAAGFLAVWYVRRHGWSAREWFLLGWTIPPVVVCTLVHFGQAGYVLTFLPALVIFLSRVLVTALGHAGESLPYPRARVALTAAGVVLVGLVDGSFFVSARPAPRDFDTPRPTWVRQAQDEAFDWIFSRTAGALREHEEVVRGFVDSIHGLYPAEETVVITEQGNSRSYPWFRHAMFYLPEYAVYELHVGDRVPGFRASRRSSTMTTIPDTEIDLPASVERLVWFVDHWSPTTVRPEGLVEIEIPYGRYLYVLPLGKEPVDYEDYTFIRAQPSRRAVSAARARPR